MRLVDTFVWVEWLTGSPTADVVAAHLPDQAACAEHRDLAELAGQEARVEHLHHGRVREPLFAASAAVDVLCGTG